MRVVTDSLKVSLLCHSHSDYFYECEYNGIRFFIYVGLRDYLSLNCFSPIDIPASVLDCFTNFFVANDMEWGACK